MRAAGNAGVPEDVCFQTKPEIALQQLREAPGQEQTFQEPRRVPRSCL